MKKLKIFLLLSILLCFGFALSSEVHAQGGGPKIFEEGDVLPATTQLRIRWNDYIYNMPSNQSIQIDNDATWLISTLNGALRILIGGGYFEVIYDDEEDDFVFPYTDYGDNHDYCDIDTSTWNINHRTISSVGLGMEMFTWEDLAAAPSGYSITFEENGGTEQTDLSDLTTLPDPLPIPTKENYTFIGWYYDDEFFTRAYPGDPLTDDVILYARWCSGKLFEEDEVLPATTELKIRIYFGHGDYHVETVDPNGIYINIDWIDDDEDYLDLYVEFGGYVRYDGEVTSYAIYYTIDISNWSSSQRTIKSVLSENGIFVTWEDATPEGYTQGYLDAREEFGYYDSRTNQWLSVDEYLDLYGTEKMGQSDFYNNFDKYFIPAMIIVFGGAIVLTVLKVFKGRE